MRQGYQHGVSDSPKNVSSNPLSLDENITVSNRSRSVSYTHLLELRPGWTEKVAVVMTGGNNDPEDWKAIIGTKAYKEELARRFKDNGSPLKIAIVVDMWLTGFDAVSYTHLDVYKRQAYT